MITLLAKVLKALNSDYSPSQIAVAICLGMIMGLTPLSAVHNVLILFLVLIVRVNVGIFLVSLTLFSGIAYLLDPIAEVIGHQLLTSAVLEKMWTAMYQVNLWRLLQFNNTLVLGSFIVAVILSPGLYWMAKTLVVQYRQRFMSWVGKHHLSMWLKGSKLMAAYRQL